MESLIKVRKGMQKKNQRSREEVDRGDDIMSA